MKERFWSQQLCKWKGPLDCAERRKWANAAPARPLRFCRRVATALPLPCRYTVLCVFAIVAVLWTKVLMVVWAWRSNHGRFTEVLGWVKAIGFWESKVNPLIFFWLGETNRTTSRSLKIEEGLEFLYTSMFWKQDGWFMGLKSWGLGEELMHS